MTNMLSIIGFLPVLALLACMSVEVTADAAPPATLYSGIPHNIFTIAIDPMNASGPNEGSQSTCTFDEVTSGDCSTTPINWKDGGSVDVTLTNMPAADSGEFMGNMVAESYQIRLCYSAVDQVDRLWRDGKDTIATDNACAIKSDPFEYPAQGGRDMQTVTLKSVAPKATFAVRVVVKCKGQSELEYCAVVNPQEDPTDFSVFFNVDVWDSRPTGLWVATLICAFIGPLLLIGFLIYERGVLAKQA